LTIALGMIADDGIVIAADRQETEGDRKKDERKVGTLWAPGIGSLLVSGAGNGPYIDSMITRLQVCFGGKVWQWGDAEEMTSDFRETNSAFYSDAVLPFANYQPYERPDYELLFGCSIKDRHLLWYSHKLTVNRAEGLRAVGIGASTAESLLKKFYVTRLPLKVAISLAAYVVFEVKRSVEGCGFETDVMFTHGGHVPPASIPAPLLKEMEDAFAQFRLLERDDLYRTIGGGVVPKNRNAKAWNKVRRDLRKTFDRFYEAFDAQPEFKESRPSASQTSESEQ
jgi:hypothetical protein